MIWLVPVIYILVMICTFLGFAWFSDSNEPDGGHFLGSVFWPVTLLLAIPFLTWEWVYNARQAYKRTKEYEDNLRIVRETEAKIAAAEAGGYRP